MNWPTRWWRVRGRFAVASPYVVAYFVRAPDADAACTQAQESLGLEAILGVQPLKVIAENLGPWPDWDLDGWL